MSTILRFYTFKNAKEGLYFPMRNAMLLFKFFTDHRNTWKRLFYKSRQIFSVVHHKSSTCGMFRVVDCLLTVSMTMFCLCVRITSKVVVYFSNAAEKMCPFGDCMLFNGIRHCCSMDYDIVVQIWYLLSEQVKTILWGREIFAVHSKMSMHGMFCFVDYLLTVSKTIFGSSWL